MTSLIQYLVSKFGATLTEARAFVVLLGLIGLIFLSAAIIRWLPIAEPPQIVFNTQMEQELARWWSAQSKNKLVREKTTEVQTFPFNPNTLSVDSLKLLGLSGLIANRIVSYRNKVGPFRSKEELKKIYDLPPEQYQRLYSYILLPAKTNQPPPATNPHKLRKSDNPGYEKISYRVKLAPFDLNNADTLQLQQIRGIGPVLSRRIAKFRDKLGGFISSQQVREIYGLPPEVADSLLVYGIIKDSFKPRRININRASREELAAHPYFSWNAARLIEQYRLQHGRFSDSLALYQIHGIGAQEWHKVMPYLTFE